MFDKVSKIPISIADTKNITDIRIKRNTIILKYNQVIHFSDGISSLSEYKKIILTYPKKIDTIDTQIDEDDNLFIGIKYKKPFSFFGWTLKRELDDSNTASETNI